MDSDNSNGRSTFTTRALLIGSLCVIFLSVITPFSDMYIQTPAGQDSGIASGHLPWGVVIVFLILIAFNIILMRINRGLSQGELIIIFCMMLVTYGISSSGFTAYLSIIPGPHYFADPENNYANLFLKHVPKWLTPRNPQTVDGTMKWYFEGLPPGKSIPWGAWIAPLAIWITFLLLFFFTLYCLSVIFRRQWVEHERLSFPLLKLPLEMVEGGQGSLIPPFFRNRLMWFGFFIPVTIYLLNNLHVRFPMIPEIPLMGPDLGSFVIEEPWRQIGFIPVRIQPTVIGISYFLTKEITFSFVFFYFFGKFARVFVTALGIPEVFRQAAFSHYPCIGGYFVFVGFLLWMSRTHLKRIFKAAFSHQTKAVDRDEPLSYRFALLGLIAGMLLLSLWCRLAGMSFWIAFTMFLIFFVAAIGLTRVVSEGGILYIQYTSYKPMDIMSQAVGSARLGVANLTVSHYIWSIFMMDLLAFIMPSFMHNFKLSEMAKINRRRLSLTIALVILLAVPVSCVTMLFMTYRFGGGMYLDYWFYYDSTHDLFEVLATQLNNPTTGPSWLNLLMMAIGGAFVLFLIFMRGTFYWWPLHPLGTLMGYGGDNDGYTLHLMWLSLFIGWLIKVNVLHYGGVKLYQRLRPFFSGLVLGTFASSGLWVLINLLTGLTD